MHHKFYRANERIKTIGLMKLNICKSTEKKRIQGIPSLPTFCQGRSGLLVDVDTSI